MFVVFFCSCELHAREVDIHPTFLGVVHHFFLSQVVLAIFEEQEEVQQNRVLGLTAPGTQERFRCLYVTNIVVFVKERTAKWM